jgi:threonine-phosphate decarboxylase
MIYGHGNEIHQLQLKADFSSNVWYKGVSEEICTLLAQHIANIGNYPEPDACSLKATIAAHFNLIDKNVIVTNGSTEAFYLIAKAFTGKKSIIICPCFAEYYDACKMHNHQITILGNTSGWHNLNFENQLVWFANPNNPDAQTITLAEITTMLKNNPSSVFVLDEAYIDLCYTAETAVPLLAEYSNLIVVRSFTKAFSMPGLRLGFTLSSKNIADKINSFLMPWNVNSLAIAAGIYIMEHYDRLLPDKNVIRKESLELQYELGKIKKLKVYPSDCNFFMLKTLVKSASELKGFLLKEYGILVRDASNFEGLDKTYFRIAIQKPDLNKKLVKGIKYWLQL